MVIDKICKMSVKGVKLKSESFFLISPGVLELRRKTLGRRIAPPSAWIGLKELVLVHSKKVATSFNPIQARLFPFKGPRGL